MTPEEVRKVDKVLDKGIPDSFPGNKGRLKAKLLASAGRHWATQQMLFKLEGMDDDIAWETFLENVRTVLKKSLAAHGI